MLLLSLPLVAAGMAARPLLPARPPALVRPHALRAAPRLSGGPSAGGTGSLSPMGSIEVRAATFAHFDQDGDGYLTARELSAAFERLDQPLTDRELAKRMSAADVNDDARISLSEFEAMCAREELEDGEADFGFEPSGYYGSDVGDPATPTNGFRSAAENFKREFAALRRATRYGEGGEVGTGGVRGLAARLARPLLAPVDEQLERWKLLPELDEERSSKPRLASLRLRDDLCRLTLSNEAIAQREKKRIADRRALQQELGGAASPLREVREAVSLETPWYVMVPYHMLCSFLDIVFDGRPLPRFWFLETVARVPYFTFTSMLHLYETLGWWRGEQLVRQLHFAQESNELHHLLIMEALGGDLRWSDRFLARHSALVYFVALCGLYLVSPALSYNFSELLESHAVDTYGQFLLENKQLLSSLPAPRVARDYYNGQRNSFLRRAMRTSDRSSTASPPYPVRTLYDVFANIAADGLSYVGYGEDEYDGGD